MDKKIKEEMSNLREQQKERISQLYSFDRALPEVEHLIQPIEVHELEDDIVTISAMDTSAIAAHVGLVVGRNEKTFDKEEEEEEEEDEDVDESGHTEDAREASSSQLSVPPIKGHSVKSVKKTLNKDVVKKMKKIKAFAQKISMEKKKKAKSAKGKNKRREKLKAKVGKRRNRPNSRPER